MCEFSKTSVKFLVRIIDEVRAVTNKQDPTDVSGVKRLLRMFNHVGKTKNSHNIEDSC